jgi:hypothetical protein
MAEESQLAHQDSRQRCVVCAVRRRPSRTFDVRKSNRYRSSVQHWGHSSIYSFYLPRCIEIVRCWG